MSKWQQIRVSIHAEYQKDLAHDFPALYRNLRALAPELSAQNPPLIELVPLLARLSLEDQADEAVRSLIGDYLGKLEDLERRIQGNIAQWRLSGAETDLNTLDDLFARLEAELAGD